jgi:hypothetical protein
VVKIYDIATNRIIPPSFFGASLEVFFFLIFMISVGFIIYLLVIYKRYFQLANMSEKSRIKEGIYDEPIHSGEIFGIVMILVAEVMFISLPMALFGLLAMTETEFYTLCLPLMIIINVIAIWLTVKYIKNRYRRYGLI